MSAGRSDADDPPAIRSHGRTRGRVDAGRHHVEPRTPRRPIPAARQRPRAHARHVVRRGRTVAEVPLAVGLPAVRPVSIVFLGRKVLLPFIFAFLIAYILAPVVRWMSERKNGTHRMPRGLAIIICYIVFLAAVDGLHVPARAAAVARRRAPRQGSARALQARSTRSTCRRPRAGSSSGSRRSPR